MNVDRFRLPRALGAGCATVWMILLAGGLSAGTSPALSSPSDDGAGIVKIAPPSPIQGDTLTVVVFAPRSSTVNVHFDGRGMAAYALPDGTRRALIGTDPNIAVGAHTLAATVTSADGAAVRFSRTISIKSGQFEVRTLTLPPKTFGLITAENAAIERRALMGALGRRTPQAMWAGVFVAPSDGLMDSPYGYQSVYNGQRMWWHQGADFADSEGAPVVAANAGIVVLAQALPLGGNTIVIDHGQGVLSEYLHLSAFTVRVGDHVGRGAQIGRIGATGLVTGPSVHWGLYVNGTWVNPLFWTAPHPGLTQ